MRILCECQCSIAGLFCATTSTPLRFACADCDQGVDVVLSTSFNGARPQKCDVTSTTSFIPTTTTTESTARLPCSETPDSTFCQTVTQANCNDPFVFFVCANLCNSCLQSVDPTCIDQRLGDNSIWVDEFGVGCEQYVQLGVCAQGSAFNGFNATEACCGCGGGTNLTTTTITTTTTSPRCNGLTEHPQLCPEHVALGNCNDSIVQRNCLVHCGLPCVSLAPTTMSPTFAPTISPTVTGATAQPSLAPSASTTQAPSTSEPTASIPTQPITASPTAPTVSPTTALSVCNGVPEPVQCPDVVANETCGGLSVQELCPVTCNACPTPGICNGITEPLSCYTNVAQADCSSSLFHTVCPVLCGTCVNVTSSPSGAPSSVPTSLCAQLNVPDDPEICANISVTDCSSDVIRLTCPRRCGDCGGTATPTTQPPSQAPSPTSVCDLLGLPADLELCSTIPVANCSATIVRLNCPRLCDSCGATTSPTTVSPTTQPNPCDTLGFPADPVSCTNFTSCGAELIQLTCPRLCGTCGVTPSPTTPSPSTAVDLCDTLNFPADSVVCAAVPISNCSSALVSSACPRLCGTCGDVQQTVAPVTPPTDLCPGYPPDIPNCGQLSINQCASNIVSAACPRMCRTCTPAPSFARAPTANVVDAPAPTVSSQVDCCVRETDGLRVCPGTIYESINPCETCICFSVSRALFLSLQASN